MELNEQLGLEPVRWSTDKLRTVRYETSTSTIVARSRGILQSVYQFSTERSGNLALRRVSGLTYRESLSNLVWMQGYTSDGVDIQIGIDPAYIFEQTGCLITPKIVSWSHSSEMHIFEMAHAVLAEMETMLGLQIQGFLPPESTPAISPRDYLSLDHKKTSKLIMLSTRSVLTDLENRIKNYCASYWSDYESMGARVQFELLICIYPLKRHWFAEELADLELGDLLVLQNFQKDEYRKCIRGALRFRGEQASKKHYEVFLEMNDENTQLRFGSDELHSQRVSQATEQERTLAPHEQIELEIHAGKTKILFNDLCSVQEGTLIELREHALPLVTLCVMGSPILEGELVHFQDQLMVQVTKRLD